MAARREGRQPLGDRARGRNLRSRPGKRQHGEQQNEQRDHARAHLPAAPRGCRRSRVFTASFIAISILVAVLFSYDRALCKELFKNIVNKAEHVRKVGATRPRSAGSPGPDPAATAAPAPPARAGRSGPGRRASKLPRIALRQRHQRRLPFQIGHAEPRQAGLRRADQIARARASPDPPRRCESRPRCRGSSSAAAAPVSFSGGLIQQQAGRGRLPPARPGRATGAAAPGRRSRPARSP